MKTLKRTIFSLVILTILAACGGSPSGTDTPTQPAPTLNPTEMNAAVEATVSAELTRIALENPPTEAPPTITPTPEPTQPPTNVPSPSPTISDLALDDQAFFVEDVTIPDGSEIVGGTEFVKTWRLLNNGLNTWTVEYTFVFVNGDRMEGFPITLDREVVPGSTIDISIPMIAPLEGGVYEGFWMLANEDNVVFGVGEDGKQAVVVSIIVIEPTVTPTATPTRAPSATPTRTPTP